MRCGEGKVGQSMARVSVFLGAVFNMSKYPETRLGAVG